MVQRNRTKTSLTDVKFPQYQPGILLLLSSLAVVCSLQPSLCRRRGRGSKGSLDKDTADSQPGLCYGPWSFPRTLGQFGSSSMGWVPRSINLRERSWGIREIRECVSRGVDPAPSECQLEGRLLSVPRVSLASTVDPSIAIYI